MLQPYAGIAIAASTFRHGKLLDARAAEWRGRTHKGRCSRSGAWSERHADGNRMMALWTGSDKNRRPCRIASRATPRPRRSRPTMHRGLFAQFACAQGRLPRGVNARKKSHAALCLRSPRCCTVVALSGPTSVCGSELVSPGSRVFSGSGSLSSSTSPDSGSTRTFASAL